MGIGFSLEDVKSEKFKEILDRALNSGKSVGFKIRPSEQDDIIKYISSKIDKKHSIDSGLQILGESVDEAILLSQYYITIYDSSRRDKK
ncbi:MAG: hypothetical protein KKF48_05280 [Nanoarchaeota archaeon]|nr:hypothetical protein [Nanoarchaeota archaeon]MBU1028431.1 hypothetical protein [Nanoarchaeota archaeon]